MSDQENNLVSSIKNGAVTIFLLLFGVIGVAGIATLNNMAALNICKSDAIADALKDSVVIQDGPDGRTIFFSGESLLMKKGSDGKYIYSPSGLK